MVWTPSVRMVACENTGEKLFNRVAPALPIHPPTTDPEGGGGAHLRRVFVAVSPGRERAVAVTDIGRRIVGRCPEKHARATKGITAE